ncbi:hypothetical protein AAVH_18423 [Aphelenchoides avenae]|nr:hypothetical protein AAVH_18423 [Aphelenchus avenae]
MTRRYGWDRLTVGRRAAEKRPENDHRPTDAAGLSPEALGRTATAPRRAVVAGLGTISHALALSADALFLLSLAGRLTDGGLSLGVGRRERVCVLREPSATLALSARLKLSEFTCSQRGFARLLSALATVWLSRPALARSITALARSTVSPLALSHSSRGSRALFGLRRAHLCCAWVRPSSSAHPSKSRS